MGGSNRRGAVKGRNSSLIDGMKPASLSNYDVKKWYLENEKKIPKLIDKNLALEEQAKQAFNLRNKYRTQARELMEDRDTAQALYKNEKNFTWDTIVKKYQQLGYDGDELYKERICSSQRSRASVNEKLGL